MVQTNLPKICENFIYEFFNKDKTACCFRFSDTHDTFQGRGRGVILPSAPSDFVVTHLNITYYAEVKSTISPIGLTASLFKQQELRRNKILKAGGEYWYFIYSETCDRWFVISGKLISENPNLKWESLMARPASKTEKEINLAWKTR